MSTESTKLTFVRCPSCRSLVPAVSTRCRMCGATLEASEDREGGGDDKRGGRVRQHTMSEMPGDVQRATDGPPAEGAEPEPKAPEVPAAEAAGADSAEEEDPFDDDLLEEDPLGAYIEEVEAQDLEEFDDDFDLGDDQGGEDDDLLDMDDPFDEPQPPAAAAPGGAAGPQEKAAPVVERQEAPPAPPVPKAPEAKPVPPVPPQKAGGMQAAPREPDAAAADAGHGKNAQRLIIEPGGKRFGKGGGGLSFGGGEQRPKQPQRPPEQKHEQRHEAKHEPRHDSKHESRHESKHEPRHEPRHEPKQAATEQRRDNKHTDGRKGQEGPGREQREGRRDAERSHGEKQHGDHREHRPPQQPQGQRGPQPRKDGQQGKLLGWLVSYEQAEGRAIELREGKFFVTGSSLKNSDLVLSHPSVSTPHAMVTLAADTGILVQDLMSDRGVFVKRGGGSYQREEGVASVQHGDWLRFGEVEFLVVLIP